MKIIIGGGGGFPGSTWMTSSVFMRLQLYMKAFLGRLMDIPLKSAMHSAVIPAICSRHSGRLRKHSEAGL
jgi:hypothetical protein